MHALEYGNHSLIHPSPDQMDFERAVIGSGLRLTWGCVNVFDTSREFIITDKDQTSWTARGIATASGKVRYDQGATPLGWVD